MPKNYLPDLRFLPEAQGNITAATPLNDGVTLGSFLNGVTLDHLTQPERVQLARNLLPHAQIVKSISANNKKFAKHKLVIVDGVYKPDPEEQITEEETSTNFLAQTGRAVVYELHRNKKVDNDKTFELAKYLQVYHKTYDNLILDYDTYIEGELNVQIVLQTPQIPVTYDVVFKNKAKTAFNNNPQDPGQLIEVTETPATKVDFPAQLPDEVAGYFTVGDVHARLLRVNGGDPWQSYATDARLSRDVVILDNIKKIKTGEVVVISIGYNDTANTNDSPETIASQVFKTVELSAVKQKHTVTFLLFPITNKLPQQKQTAVRNAIVAKLNSIPNLRIVDLAATQYQLGFDGVSLTPESYISISNILI